MLSTDVLSHLLDEAAISGHHGYHLKCKGLRVTHLCFGEDTLVFSDCSVKSFEAPNRSIDHSYSLSGLKLSANKTEFFCTGVAEGQIYEIDRFKGFRKDSLPIHYLVDV